MQGGQGKEMTRRGDKLNRLLQVGAIYTGTVRVRLKGACKITRTFIHQRQLMYNEEICSFGSNGFLSLSGKGRCAAAECS